MKEKRRLRRIKAKKWVKKVKRRNTERNTEESYSYRRGFIDTYLIYYISQSIPLQTAELNSNVYCLL